MPQKCDAEVFIRVLTELWEEDRRLKDARLRRELQAHVQRFVQEFHAEPRNVRPGSNWAPLRARSARTAVMQIHGE